MTTHEFPDLPMLPAIEMPGSIFALLHRFRYPVEENGDTVLKPLSAHASLVYLYLRGISDLRDEWWEMPTIAELCRNLHISRDGIKVAFRDLYGARLMRATITRHPHAKIPAIRYEFFAPEQAIIDLETPEIYRNLKNCLPFTVERGDEDEEEDEVEW